MKSLKYILLFLFFASATTYAQKYNFKTSGYMVSQKDKKGNWVYTINPKDTENVRTLYLEVYKNGKAYLSIDSNDRQPISYDGYIMKNEIKNKID